LLYDFGAVTVTYEFPINGPFADLLQLSELYDNEFLLSDSRLRVNQLLKVMGEAANQASVDSVVEDYVVFHIESFTRLTPAGSVPSRPADRADSSRRAADPLRSRSG
jgi:hypothetical protein